VRGELLRNRHLSPRNGLGSQICLVVCHACERVSAVRSAYVSYTARDLGIRSLAAKGASRLRRSARAEVPEISLRRSDSVVASQLRDPQQSCVALEFQRMDVPTSGEFSAFETHFCSNTCARAERGQPHHFQGDPDTAEATPAPIVWLYEWRNTSMRASLMHLWLH